MNIKEFVNIIETQPIIEDRYIAHLAGQKNSTDIIESQDYTKASMAQNRPIRNRLLLSSVATLGGFLASLSYKFFESRRSACETCAINKISWYTKPFFADKNLCINDEQMHLLCRISNYVHGIFETVSNHYVLIGAIVLGLAATLSSSKMNEIERQAENELKRNLTDRYGKIASRLSDREKDPAICAIVENILQRRFDINQDVAKLELPNLAWKDIESITEPVFKVAERIHTNSRTKAGA